MDQQKIYIIGAGISGLIAAYELERAGYFPEILEASDGVGGRVRTDIENGFRLDRGFQVLLTAYPEAQRYLDYEKNQLAAGQNIWTLRLTADYVLSKNLTAIFYYDHSFSQAVVSTTFPLTNIRSGFTLRYNFGN